LTVAGRCGGRAGSRAERDRAPPGPSLHGRENARSYPRNARRPLSGSMSGTSRAWSRLRCSTSSLKGSRGRASSFSPRARRFCGVSRSP